VLQEIRDGSVRLAVGKNQLDEFKLDGPESAGGRPGDALDVLVMVHVQAKQEFRALLSARSDEAAEMWRKLAPMLELLEHTSRWRRGICTGHCNPSTAEVRRRPSSRPGTSRKSPR
jgi:hypothetical protein